jgi:hypothetical protein
MDLSAQEKTISVTLNLKPERDGELYDSISEVLEGVDVKERHFILKRMLRLAIANGALQEIQASRSRSHGPKRARNEKRNESGEVARAVQSSNPELEDAKSEHQRSKKANDAMAQMMMESLPFG